MCGRYNLIADGAALVNFFDLVNRLDWAPRYNIAPSQEAPVVVAGRDGRHGGLMRWGLIPHWARDAKFGYHTINARVETVAEKPAYRQAFRRRRCLVPATGFYEWQPRPQGKQPWHIRPQPGGLFAMAGLWERWRNPAGEEVLSYTILVTDAPPRLAAIHDRMPVILPHEAYQAWLDPGQRDPRALQDLLAALSPPALEAWPVSTRVNSPAHEGPELIEPVATPE